MEKFSFGEIVLLKFPYTDGLTYKRRPSLIISDFEDGDIVVCRITSQVYDSNQDVYIESWEKSGLKLPSIVRVHKIATLDKAMVEVVMGKIDEQLARKIKSIFANLAE